MRGAWIPVWWGPGRGGFRGGGCLAHETMDYVFTSHSALAHASARSLRRKLFGRWHCWRRIMLKQRPGVSLSRDAVEVCSCVRTPLRISGLRDQGVSPHCDTREPPPFHGVAFGTTCPLSHGSGFHFPQPSIFHSSRKLRCRGPESPDHVHGASGVRGCQVGCTPL